jgi:hypothetical protein
MDEEIDAWDYNVLLARVATQKVDDWLANVLEQAMELLRAKNIFNCKLRSAVGTATGGMFSLERDKGMATMYDKKMHDHYGWATFCLPNNYHLLKMHMCTYANKPDLFSDHNVYTEAPAPPNHTQYPDSVAVMRFTDESNEDKHMTVLYEGENHQKNRKLAGKGGWLWSKMFQAMGLCHDIDSSVSGVMISAVMYKHNPADFTPDTETPHFAHMAAAYLRAHVKLLKYLLEYNRSNTKATTWIGRQLAALAQPLPVAADNRYDFVCSINAAIHDGFEATHVSYAGPELLATTQLSEGEEFVRYDNAVKELYPRLAASDIVLGPSLLSWRTPVYRMQFNAGSRGARGMHVVIHAVLRAPNDALLPTGKRPILGVLYPMHVQALVDHLKAGAAVQKDSHIKRSPKQTIFEVSSDSMRHLLGWSHLDDENWMFGHRMGKVHSVWNLWNLDFEGVEHSVRRTANMNALRVAAVPRQAKVDDILERLKKKKDLVVGRALSCETEGYFMFILPLMYMSMAVFRKISMELQYDTGRESTKKQWAAFVKTFLHERLARGNNISIVSATRGLLFTSLSKSLFSVIMRATHVECAEIVFETTLTNFLKKECGWEDLDRADSPALIFKILRTTDLLSAQTLAQQVLSAPPLRYTQILETFPLGLQTEIKYAMGRLASFIFFKASDYDGHVEPDSDGTDSPHNEDEDDEDGMDRGDETDEEEEGAAAAARGGAGRGRGRPAARVPGVRAASA